MTTLTLHRRRPTDAPADPRRLPRSLALPALVLGVLLAVLAYVGLATAAVLAIV